MGFGPQLVDFDSDGLDDIVSGDWLGRVIVFRRVTGESFAAGEPLRNRDGKTIRVDYGPEPSTGRGQLGESCRSRAACRA